MHADMTAVTIQSNRIVWNEVKDNYALLEPSYRKPPTNFLANLVCVCVHVCVCICIHVSVCICVYIYDNMAILYKYTYSEIKKSSLQ